MLTDVFENRYQTRRIWTEFGHNERRLLMQCAHILVRQLYPVWTPEGNANEKNKTSLKSFLDKVALEVGIKEFHPRYFTNTRKWNGNDIQETHEWPLDTVYTKVFGYELAEGSDPDRWMKRCLSIVELAFRFKEAEINIANERLPSELKKAKDSNRNTGRALGVRIPAFIGDGLSAANRQLNAFLKSNVDELNTRFEQAGVPLSYHNGFIQIKSDQLTSEAIEEPFWRVVARPEWSSVDTDMKHALHLRDTGGRDPAFYAARALESVVKIISNKAQRTRGGERGAGNFVDNLMRDDGGRFIDVWEGEVIKAFFAKVRNPLGHGPGEGEIAALTKHQTDWAIETCMSWIKSLVSRLPE